MAGEIASVRITVRFTPAEAARIDAAVGRYRSAYGYRADRSQFIKAAIGAALERGCKHFPPEPATSDGKGPKASDAARGASDAPGASDTGDLPVGRAAARPRGGRRGP